MKKGLITLFLVISILLSFGAGFYFGNMHIPSTPPEGVLNAELGMPDGVDFSLFWQAWRTLENAYVDKDDIDYQEMIYGAVSGMVGSLGDPYTVYFPPEDAEIFKEDVTGEFQGVGMEIGIRDSQLTVIAPMEGTPAERAGLRAGDKITAINGTSTQGISSDGAVKLIRGPKGTEVVLTVYREGWAETRDFTIVRDVIEIPSVKLDIRDDGVAYIQLYQFSEAARSAFGESAVNIINSGAEAVVLDLRNNPGGYLEVAQYIAGWFLERGEIVAIEDFGSDRKPKEYKAEGPSSLLSYPLVVLINQGSASGSEILAGALRDNRGVKLVGEQSFGKGSVQTLEDLSEGSLKVTVARWLTPAGTLINGKGLAPDVEVELTEDDFNEDRDPQLDRAIEIVKEMD
ncbi:MAG: S41 family peptidase [Candidatus Pacebacteria bacterium]|jgi:carboxyl-terminal processing protease|nr:S41 family peptidase [Candidatus Paceibacterota bacterium]